MATAEDSTAALRPPDAKINSSPIHTKSILGVMLGLVVEERGSLPTEVSEAKP